MSIQDRLNLCLQSMKIDPLNRELKDDDLDVESKSFHEQLDSSYLDKNKDSINDLDKNKDSINDLNKNKDSINDLEEELDDEQDNIFNQDLSISQKIILDEKINLEVKKRIALNSELYMKTINKRFMYKENELKKMVKEIEESKKIIDEKIKLNKNLMIEYQLKEQEVKKKYIKLKEGQIKLKKDQEEIELNIINERNKLTQEFNKLIKLRSYFENDSENKYIKLNVGGKIFETTQNLLKNHSDYFKGLLSGKFKVLKDDNNIIFIDRCPDLFKEIMKIIRDLDRGDKIEKEITLTLIKELDYYLIDC
jgi:hypothetical protein